MTFKTPPATPQAPALDTIGDRIKATRYAWGWSQAHFAGIIGCDQASVSFWERGVSNPAGTTVTALAALFGCSRPALEVGEGFVVPAFPSDIPAFKPREG